MKANGVNVFKILNFGPSKQQRNLTFGQSGIVRKFKRRWTWSLRVLENLTLEESGLYLGSDKLSMCTKASSENILFNGTSIYHTDMYMSTLGNNIKNINHLMPNDPYSGRTAPLTSKHCVLYIYSTNIGTEYFKHGIYSPSFSLQNADCFIILTYLVTVLFTFYIQCVLNLHFIYLFNKYRYWIF